MADTINDRTRHGDPQGSRRSKQGGRRPHKVEFRLTDEEFELLEEAATRSGRARGAYQGFVKVGVAVRDLWGGLTRPSGRVPGVPGQP